MSLARNYPLQGFDPDRISNTRKDTNELLGDNLISGGDNLTTCYQHLIYLLKHYVHVTVLEVSLHSGLKMWSNLHNPFICVNSIIEFVQTNQSLTSRYGSEHSNDNHGGASGRF